MPSGIGIAATSAVERGGAGWPSGRPARRTRRLTPQQPSDPTMAVGLEIGVRPHPRLQFPL
eukprot:scaffold11361_cov32-Tisochrysis_lutea.AAC.2